MSPADDHLTAPYRSVRPIAAPGDGPWPGMLSCLPSGELRVHVDAARFDDEWRGWDAAPDGHVLGALDVVRRHGGHDVALPVCSEPLDAYLARRRSSPTPLSPGEAVTIGVSLLRACGEIVDGRPVSGAWWLLETGRPVFATDAAPAPFLDVTLALLEELARVAPHPTAWSEAVAAAAAVRVSSAELDRAESGLFDTGPATALDLRPAGVRGSAALTTGLIRPASSAGEEPEPRPRGIWESLARHVDADLADAISRATTSVWRRARAAPGRRRRAPLLVAAGAAVAVVGVGLMWPGEDGGSARAGNGPLPSSSSSPTSPPPPSSVSSASSDRDATPTPAEGDAESPSGPEELEAVTDDLLDRLDACGADDSCREETLMDPAAWRPTSGVVPAGRREIELLDDFGGVAVLRLDDGAGEHPSQLIVIARQNGEWLLRDVHDVTQQP